MSRTETVEQALDRMTTSYALAPTAPQRLRALLRTLAEDEHAPTTVRDPRAAVGVHIADSLVALDLPVVRDAQTVADLGAGAGFPGLPLAVALPTARVALVESVARKCLFITMAAEAAELDNVTVVPERAESWHAGMEGQDLVTARALASLSLVAEYAAPLLRVGGTLVAWKGRRDPEEERDAAAAAEQLGLEIGAIHAVAPYAGADHRHLHLLHKVAPTPDRFPRRPGIAHKRPLRAARPRPSDRPQR